MPFIGESRTMQVYAAKTVYKSRVCHWSKRAGLSSMMFARIFMIILMVGGVWCERCPECAEPAGYYATNVVFPQN